MRELRHNRPSGGFQNPGVCLQAPRGGELPWKSLMGTWGQPGYVFRDFCLKQGTFLNSFVIANGFDKKEFRVRVGQGMRGWAAPPHPRIYRVPTHPHPPGLQAFPSFLPHPLPPSFSCDIFRAVFDSRSSFFAHRPHRNACYASYVNREEKNLLLPQSAWQLFPISF